MKTVLAALAMVVFAHNAQADVVVAKAMDGNVAYCNAETQKQNGKVIQVEMSKLSSGDFQEDASIAVSLVKCNGTEWVADKNPSVEQYTAPNGEDVKVTYSNYEFILVNQNYDILLITSLDHLNNRGTTETTSVSLTRTRGVATQDFTALIRVVKTVEASGGMKYSEIVTFGAFNLRMNNPN